MARRCCCRRLSSIFLRTLSSTPKFLMGRESVLNFFSKSLERCRILPISCDRASSFDRQLLRKNSITSFVQLLYPSTTSWTSPRLFVSTWISISTTNDILTLSGLRLCSPSCDYLVPLVAMKWKCLGKSVPQLRLERGFRREISAATSQCHITRGCMLGRLVVCED